MTRNRYTGTQSMPRIITIYDDPPGAVVQTYDAGTLNGYQSITDVPTPGYSRIKARGDIIMSPVAIEKYSFTGTDDSLTAVGPPVWGYRQWTGPMASILVEDAGLRDNVLDDLASIQASVINKAYAKAYSAPAALGVTLFEGNETLRMIGKPLGRSRDLLSKMLRRKFSLMNRGVAASKAMASAWLEYRLGWKPLLYDIDNIMNATARHLVSNRTTERQVARASQTIDSFVNREHALAGQLHFSSGLARTAKTVSYKASAGVIYETKILSDDGIVSERLRHNYGLQLRDVATTGWELIPFSFVVDRFLEVGTWLEAIQPNPNVTILGSWASLKTNAHSVKQIKYLQVNTEPTKAITGPSSEFTEEWSSLVRTVGVTPSTLPVLNLGSLSLSQHVDHVALLVSMGVNFRRK